MAYIAWFKLRRNPCFECNGEGFTRQWPWIELLASRAVHSVMSDCSDAFITGEDFMAICPYCGPEEDPFDEYDFRFDP